MSEEERNTVEDWAAHCFQSLLFNLGSPIQQSQVYIVFGLDPERVLAGVREIIQNDEARRERLKSQTNIFRVLIKTWNNACLITERTRAFYATYVDIEELRSEGKEDGRRRHCRGGDQVPPGNQLQGPLGEVRQHRRRIGDTAL